MDFMMNMIIEIGMMMDFNHIKLRNMEYLRGND